MYIQKIKTSHIKNIKTNLFFCHFLIFTLSKTNPYTYKKEREFLICKKKLY